MKGRFWVAAGAFAVFTLPGTVALAQITGANPAPMKVLMEFYPAADPWDLAPRMASLTGMQLLGVSPSTHSAVFVVVNETTSGGTVAARNEEVILKQFPGTVSAYNYGQNLELPRDVRQTRPSGQPTRRREALPSRGAPRPR
ncbi:MAG: hypothetical protein HY700_21450 [Gemmatimonadetes bacterium]|nr:hypothetical protein [Gemmatimonadota bacterium]